MCKERFIVITRKRLPAGPVAAAQQAAEAAAAAADTSVGTAASSRGGNAGRGRKRTRQQAAEIDTPGATAAGDATASGGGAGGGSDDDSEDPDEAEGPPKRLKGTVVETRVVEDRKQVRELAGPFGFRLLRRGSPVRMPSYAALWSSSLTVTACENLAEAINPCVMSSHRHPK